MLLSFVPKCLQQMKLLKQLQQCGASVNLYIFLFSVVLLLFRHAAFVPHFQRPENISIEQFAFCIRYLMKCLLWTLMLAVTALVPYGKDSELCAANLLSSWLQYLNMNRRHVLISDVDLGTNQNTGYFSFPSQTLLQAVLRGGGVFILGDSHHSPRHSWAACCSCSCLHAGDLD